jgi:hypothetical protein
METMRTLLIAASLIALTSAGAFADADHMHATLVNPAKERSFIAASVVWHCDGTSCVTNSSLLEMGPKGLCRALAKKEGPIASFDELDTAQLEKCNATKG